MKKKFIYISVVFILFSINVDSLNSQSLKSKEKIADLTIQDLRIENKNIHLVLSEIAKKFKIPIGLQVSSYDDLLSENGISVNIKKDSLKNILDSIVAQNSIYSWDIKNGVVNVFPKETFKDPLIDKVLSAKLDEISIKNGFSKFAFRGMIFSKTEIQQLLKEKEVTSESEAFSSYDLSEFGKNFSFESSNITLIELLNTIIEKSDTKYWSISRYGDRKQFLLINF